MATALIAAAYKDAQHLSASLSPLHPVLQREPSKLQDFTSKDDKRSQAELFKLNYTKWTNSLQASFIQEWIQNSLHERLTSIFDYGKNVNEYLSLSLRGGKNMQNGTQHLGDEITEILSLHGEFEHGLRPVGAVFVSKAGDLIGTGAPSTHLQSTETYSSNKMSLIRHKLNNDETWKPQKSGLIHDVPNVVQTIKTDLYFREQADRYLQVKESHKKTLGWVFAPSGSDSLSPFRSWLESDASCFWVNGKAGSGKSTLMKFIRDYPSLPEILKTWARGRYLITASFFFWNAGLPLQKTYEGLLRSLLYQVLEARPDLTTIIFPKLSEYLMTTARDSLVGFQIRMTELREAFKLLTTALSHDCAVFLMMDGIDEYNGDHHEFSRFLLECASTDSALKILISSRPIAACSQVFSGLPQLRLQDLTRHDIRAYIEVELLHDQLLLDMEALEPGFSHEVENALMEKASGVFLWVFLVVRGLLKGLADYDDRTALIKAIDELPTDLEALYDHMFNMMSHRDQQHGSLLLQLMMRAKDVQACSFTALQLHTSFQIKHELEGVLTLPPPEQDGLRVKAIEGILRSRCCGLVEVQYRDADGALESPIADFLHRTVYDYLRAEPIWKRIISVYNMTPSNRDLRLLASCVLALDRLHASDPDESRNKGQLFAASLEYSSTASEAQDKRYVDLLKATETYMTFKDNKRHSAVYCSAAGNFLSRWPCALPAAATTWRNEWEFLPIAWISTLVIACLNLSDYFEIKVRRDLDSLQHKGLLLEYLLALATLDGLDSTLAKCYAQNIRTLLQDGTDPCIQRTGQLSSPFTDVGLTSSKSGYSTPWTYWLSKNVKTIGQLHITIQLLEAGATYQPPDTRKAWHGKDWRPPAEQRLRALVHACKRKGLFPIEAEYGGSQELIPVAFLPSTQEESTKHRSSKEESTKHRSSKEEGTKRRSWIRRIMERT